MAHSTDTIAKGCFGKVYKEKYDDKWAAVKRVPQHLITRKDLERECDVYNKVQHPNIVKLLGNISLVDKKWVIPLEFIFGEDLETTIFKTAKSKIQLTPAIKGTIIMGMCEGLLQLHSKDVVHQDLKPENIMVEHNTNRAVIIDLGLAKFFRNGLNSAMDLGNEAYSAPEVLQRVCQRDQRSDVWAMGKMIAELCARIRLYTPSVCPAKIRETLPENPFCQPVCRMVEPNPALRASMAGIISEIRRAGGGGIVPSTLPQRDLLNPPPSRNQFPSPVNRNQQQLNRDPSAVNRNLLQLNRDPPAANRDPSAVNRNLLQLNRDPPAANRDPFPVNRTQLFNRDPPLNKGPSPMNWERAPRPEFKTPSPPSALQQQQQPSHLLPKAADKSKNQALVPVRGAAVTNDFMKMKLYEEAGRDLPQKLPATGRVLVQRFEEKDGEVEMWQQKEVVTSDGKIIKFDNVIFNSK